jgi:selenide,water dikinase
VDSPYDYGQIAVANSLSDIYAMGAMPISALNVVGFPIATLDKKILAEILKGGWEKAREANVVIMGGHSVKDPEVKYGLAVTAMINPNKIIRNSTAREGDVIILTKPLGTGILTTALKNEKLPQDLLDLVTRQMKRLNKSASEIMLAHQVSACTDVTGFGLLGHLLEMMESSHMAARLEVESISFLPEVFSFIADKQIPGGLKENLAFLKPHIDFQGDISEAQLQAICDPQTSGGLLFCIPEKEADNCLNELRENGDSEAGVIGKVLPQREKPLLIA